MNMRMPADLLLHDFAPRDAIDVDSCDFYAVVLLELRWRPVDSLQFTLSFTAASAFLQPTERTSLTSSSYVFGAPWTAMMIIV